MGDGAIDTGLEVVSWFDWITSAWEIVGNVVHGGGYGLLIPRSSLPGSANDVCKLLNKHGVKNWAPQIVGDTFTVNVKNGDAARACSLLKSQGVTVENPPEGQPQRKASGRPQRGGLMRDVFSVFDVFD